MPIAIAGFFFLVFLSACSKTASSPAAVSKTESADLADVGLKYAPQAKAALLQAVLTSGAKREVFYFEGNLGAGPLINPVTKAQQSVFCENETCSKGKWFFSGNYLSSDEPVSFTVFGIAGSGLPPYAAHAADGVSPIENAWLRMRKQPLAREASSFVEMRWKDRVFYSCLVAFRPEDSGAGQGMPQWAFISTPSGAARLVTSWSTPGAAGPIYSVSQEEGYLLRTPHEITLDIAHFPIALSLESSE